MSSANQLMAHRWLRPFVDLLKQGMSPEKIALTIALGAVLGVTPVLGSTTILCSLAALLLRLNLPAIQLVNGAVYPLQIILLIPYYKAGAWIFRANTSGVSLNGVLTLFQIGILHAIRSLWVVTMHALVAWLATGVACVLILYVIFLPVTRSILRQIHARRTQSSEPV